MIDCVDCLQEMILSAAKGYTNSDDGSHGLTALNRVVKKSLRDWMLRAAETVAQKSTASLLATTGSTGDRVNDTSQRLSNVAALWYFLDKHPEAIQILQTLPSDLDVAFRLRVQFLLANSHRVLSDRIKNHAEVASHLGIAIDLFSDTFNQGSALFGSTDLSPLKSKYKLVLNQP